MELVPTRSKRNPYTTLVRSTVVLEARASQAAAALEHAQLFERLEIARKEEATLLEVTSAISSNLDLDTLLAKVMTATTKLLGAERSTLFIHDAKTGELWSRVAEGVGSKEIRFPSDAGIAGEAFTTRKNVEYSRCPVGFSIQSGDRPQDGISHAKHPVPADA